MRSIRKNIFKISQALSLCKTSMCRSNFISTTNAESYCRISGDVKKYSDIRSQQKVIPLRCFFCLTPCLSRRNDWLYGNVSFVWYSSKNVAAHREVSQLGHMYIVQRIVLHKEHKWHLRLVPCLGLTCFQALACPFWLPSPCHTYHTCITIMWKFCQSGRCIPIFYIYNMILIKIRL